MNLITNFRLHCVGGVFATEQTCDQDDNRLLSRESSWTKGHTTPIESSVGPRLSADSSRQATKETFTSSSSYKISPRLMHNIKRIPLKMYL